jgi:hypothetical protein
VEAVMRAQTILVILLGLRSLGAAAPAATPTSPRTARAAGDDASAGDPGAAPVDLELAGARGPVIGPPIGAVLAAAYATAGLDHDPGGSWNRRARLAGLVPWVTVRTARDTSWQDQHTAVGHGTSLEVRATWRLDRLVFDSHELQVSSIGAARRRERQRLATRVIHSYFAWRRAAGAAGAGDDRVTSRLAEATAELDALTDGWFSEAIARLGRAPSDTDADPPAVPPP